MTTPAPAGAEDGRYIVLLKEKPLATYEGGTNDFAPTKPGKGNQLDAHSPNSQKYAAHLKKQQAEVAADAGVTPDTSYSVTVNGFAAQLTGEQVAELSHDKAVLGVFPDETFHPTSSAVPSTEFLGLGSGAAGAGGVWDAVGGTAQAGKGVVVGVIDTGIAPENPSFAGSPLKKKSGTGEPYTVNGDTIVFDKADGGQFRSPITIAQSWNKQNYSTKLVGGQYFAQGATASGFDFSSDYLSPRDGDGHGSHTASTAAGNFGVPTTVEGVDFGKISGVAPAAKVAMYKACFVGPDVLVTEDDICAGSDLIAAIDKAVEDGVDVINYSIGGGAAATVFGPDDWAFFGAAQAGVYVAVSAGNDGPGASTADHASPWYTTVAASTIPTYEGTVKFPGFNHAGASVSVPFGKEITAPSVFAGDIGIAANASLCYPGSIDPAKAAGHIVVCVRGGNARVEKSDVVKAAGGTGMVLVNSPTGANSLDNDFHSVPTVHMSNVYYSQILGYVQGGADRPITLVGDNVSGEVTPTPQIAGFSSRGPILADGSDVIKPDVSAPGVAILAATHNGPNAKPTFGFKSGTSMSSPHVAGLGALYLGVHPKASPAEIKSALMTTAYDLVDANGDPDTDPFEQGAGHVDPTKYLSPGLLYLNRPQEWAGYIEGATGVDYFDGIDPTDPSNLNIASIGVGALAGSQTITRTVTAAKAGTYTASVDIPGITAEVSPASFSIAAGATQEFTITLTTADAAIGEWATGFLTWTGGDTSVRSPIAVRPVEADVPASVTGTGADGSTDVTFTPGFTGTLDLHAVGLAPENVIIDGDQTTGASTGGTTNVIVDVAAGTELARFALDSSDDSGSDLDLVVYHLVDGTNTYDRAWQSATGSADEAVTIPNPPAGRYVVSADVFSFTQPFTWTATSALVTAGGAGGFAVTPNSMAVQQAQPAQYTASWSGLSAGGYLGVVRYGDSELRTLVFVDVP